VLDKKDEELVKRDAPLIELLWNLRVDGQPVPR
jgi:hypothetical protein